MAYFKNNNLYGKIIFFQDVFNSKRPYNLQYLTRIWFQLWLKIGFWLSFIYMLSFQFFLVWLFWIKGSLLCMSLSLSGENHLIIHDGAGLFTPIRILPWQTKNVFHNITQFTVLCERLSRIIFRSLWRKNSRPQHPLAKSLVEAYIVCVLWPYFRNFHF